jgi:protoheme IX farnesyltransferase
MKLPVGLMSAATALLGWAAAEPTISGKAALTIFSVFLLSSGASVLNNVQDRVIDGQRERTRQRPLPQNRLLPRQALLQAAVLIAGGIAGLCLWTASGRAPLAGLVALVLYNALYTPLKKKTVWALIPGLLSGVFPLLIGCLAAGGDPTSPRILYLATLFGLWQVPHLWLVALAHHREGELPVVPTVLRSVSGITLRRRVIIWIAAFAFLTLFLKPFHLVDNGFLVIIIIANALALPGVFAVILRKSNGAVKFRYLFQYLNVSALGITVMATVDSLGFF